MKRLTLAIVAVATITVSAKPTDSTLTRIKTEGLEHSQVAEIFYYLTINIGPRLTASPAHKRAVEWTRDRLRRTGWRTCTWSRGSSAAAGNCRS